MSKPKPLIRPATVMDSVNLVRLITAGWEESPAFHIASMDQGKLMDYVTNALKHCFCVVAEQERRILGSVCLVPIRLPWTPTATVLAEGWFMVQAGTRRRGVPELLLDAVDTFLDQQKLTAIMGSNLLAPPEMNEAMADRPGYIAARQTYLRTFDFRDAEGRPVSTAAAAK